MLSYQINSFPSQSDVIKARKKQKQKKLEPVVDVSKLNLAQTIGYNLKQLRKKRGITQTYVACFVLYSTQAGVSDLERGKKEMAVTDLLALCNHFEQPPEFFLGRFYPALINKYQARYN